jgi:outer membrane cobalamin receptor
MNPRLLQAKLLVGVAFFVAGAAGAQTATTTSQAPPTQPESTAGGAMAQPTEPYDEEEAIVVTGQKPPGSVVGDIPPEKTLDSRDVRATGATNITELLDAIAPEIGSARGRGGEQPVLLLNGQRISSFRELRDIPPEAIIRVEILPEEVALKYGYRADQRVVNIVLRQRFRSTAATLGESASTEGGYASGQADLTRLMIEKNGRTQFNLHAQGNGMLTEAERDVQLSPDATVDDRAFRSLLGTNRQIRGAATFNRQVLGDASATLNTEVEHDEGHSLIGFGDTLLEQLDRNTTSDSAHAGVTLNGATKTQWKWTVTGNADWDRDNTSTDRDNMAFPRDHARETRISGDITATANGSLFKLPAGNAGATFRVGANTQHLDGESERLGVETSNSLSRTTGTASVNLDLPVSRRNRAFSALGNLTLNANAELDQISDFGSLTTIGAGANWSPVDRLNLITSWTREEGAPTIQQLGDPVLTTPDTRIFDFTTGQTVLVTAITGGNPDLESDRRNVLKIGGNWQPFKNTDLRLRADYVHQTIDRPISNISVTPQVEAAFPGRFVRDGSGQLVSVDLRPVNFDSSRRDALRVGFDFSKPLKSKRPSQSTIDQLRAQFRAAMGGAAAGRASSVQGQNAPPPPPEGGAPPPGEGAGPPPEGGGGFGGRGFGGRGGGGGGGFFGGGNRGRLTFSLTDTITFVDKTLIAPGLELDYLHGDAAGSTGGTPRHSVEAQAGYFNNGLGARLGANWRSGTHVDTLTGDTLRFSPLATFDLRLFANPGDIPEVAVKHAWLRGTQVRFEVKNIFDSKPRVRSALGDPLLNYQPDLLDPLGRTVGISIRKLFLPPPSYFRRQFQQRQQQQQQQSPTG